MPTLRPIATRMSLAASCVLLATLLTSQPAPREQVGPLPNGAFLLNSGWRLHPVGSCAASVACAGIRPG